MKATNYAEKAAHHHSTLNAFASIVILLEGSLVYDSAAYGTANKIIRICKSEEQRQLKKYDAAMARVKKEKR